MSTHKILCSIILAVCSLSAQAAVTDTLSLHGNWGLLLDTATVFNSRMLTVQSTDSMRLPGTTDRAKKGFRNDDYSETSNLSREYRFDGKALYTRQVSIPTTWRGKAISLLMERTKPTTVWVDGKPAGHCDDISTAQRYDLSQLLTPGSHTLSILVDNSRHAVPEQVYSSSHAYSESTQTNWNGIIGSFRLEASEPNHIADIQVTPHVSSKSATITIMLSAPSRGYELSMFAETFNTDKATRTATTRTKITNNELRQTIELFLDDEAQLWSEYSAALYRLNLSLTDGKTVKDNRTATFGLREFKTDGGQFTINGKKTFLRGKHDACVFPLTGHTAMDVSSWRHYFQVAKQYGINHYRFHSWCPPEACFEAADIEGIYLQPELPIWGEMKDDDSQLLDFLLKEGRNIQQTYGNHPSFVMFAMGNEMRGEKALATLVGAFHKNDGRQLIASGSNNYLGMNGPAAGDDYFTTCRVGKEAPGTYNTEARASFSFADVDDGGYLNHTYPNTSMDFSTPNALCSVPIISHETGQFQIYPDYSEMQKYTGVLKPRNMQVFKDRLAKAGMEGLDKAFSRASGKWAARLYRADIEMNLRTERWGGFQLLDIQDYPGQGSAYVGILDAFMDSKGLISPEEWRHFCNQVVPLLVADKLCWSNDETLTADVKVTNYSADDISGAKLVWTLADAGKNVIGSGTQSFSVPQGSLGTVLTISQPLTAISKAQKVSLNLAIEGTAYSNQYDLWIYPSDNLPTKVDGVAVAHHLEEAIGLLEQGQKVLLMPAKEDVESQTVGPLFQTDYWNWRMFKTISESNHRPVSPGTLGILTDPTHGAFVDFPTEEHTDWQWFPVIKHSYPMILDILPTDYKPIIQVIDNVERDHRLGLLFEFNVGTGKLLVCMSDLDSTLDKPEGRQFLSSLLQYMQGPRFNPEFDIDAQSLRELFHDKATASETEELNNISYWPPKKKKPCINTINAL